jgi:phospholipase/carboxylesterase
MIHPKTQQPGLIKNMQLALHGPSVSPKSGVVKNIVIFLHGYGSNGDDLISLAAHWREFLPDTAFYSPNAPYPCGMASFTIGYQWFDLSGLDFHKFAKNVTCSLPILQTYINQLAELHELQTTKIALVGFSQGAIMSLRAGLERREPIAGIVGYSGAYLPEDDEHVRSRPDTLIIHGDLDDIVTIDYFYEAVAALQKLNVPLKSHVCQGLRHGIDEAGITLGGEFLKKVLYSDGKVKQRLSSPSY